MAIAGIPANRIQSNACSTLSTLVYRSRALGAFDERDLPALVKGAQRRNAREALTGCVVYDSGRFLQWLEGPEVGLKRVVASIQNDPRHGDIEVLRDSKSNARVFSSWSMQLSVGGDLRARLGTNAMEAPRRLIESLHRHPGQAPDLLKKISRSEQLSQDARRRSVAEILDTAELREHIKRALAFNATDAVTPDVRRVTMRVSSCSRLRQSLST